MTATTQFPVGSIGYQHETIALQQEENARIATIGDRRELRKALDEAIAAFETRRQLDEKIAELENELESLVQRHQADAAAIHTKLRTDVSATKREELRNKLQSLNDALQRDCDLINSQIDATHEARRSADVTTNTRTTIESKLRQSADPQLHLELEVAEISLEWSDVRLRAIKKRIYDFGESDVKNLELATAAQLFDEAQSEIKRLREAMLQP